jgi:hypothetical protein
MSRRILREFMVMGCSTAGAVLGYCAATEMEPTVQLALPFLGMALFGAFAEICMRGR